MKCRNDAETTACSGKTILNLSERVVPKWFERSLRRTCGFGVTTLFRDHEQRTTEPFVL